MGDTIKEQAAEGQLQKSKSDVGIAKKPSAFERLMNFFLLGPYFNVVPAAGVDAEEFHKKLHLIITDKGGEYSVPPDHLVTLPFDTPKFYEYLQDIFLGTFTVTQYILVLFIVMMVENEQRRSTEPRAWIDLVKTLLIIYPAVTMIMLILMTCEYTIRRFMYYRLLSLQILVDWDNLQLWHGWFFWYFVSTWALINVWALYGVIRYWGIDDPGKPDTVSFATWGVVNLQTIQLLVYYMRLQTAELRLITLNKFIERAPVQAQALVDFTFVIKEIKLQEECYEYIDASRLAWRMRAANIFSLGYYGKDWSKYDDDAIFDINRLKLGAENRKKVLAAERRLNMRPSLVDDEELEEHRDELDEIELQPSEKKQEGEQDKLKSQAVQLTADAQLEQPQKLSKLKTKPRTKEKGFFTRMLDIIDWLPKQCFKGLYATSHAMFISTMARAKSWPFRDDVKYFRFLLLCEGVCLLAVGGMLAYGIIVAVSTQCKSVYAYCRSCETNYDKFVLREGQCNPGKDGQLDVMIRTINTLVNSTLKTTYSIIGTNLGLERELDSHLPTLTNALKTLADVTYLSVTNSTTEASQRTSELFQNSGL